MELTADVPLAADDTSLSLNASLEDAVQPALESMRQAAVGAVASGVTSASKAGLSGAAVGGK